MSTVYIVVTAATIAANAWAAFVDFTRAPFVLANMTELGIPESWLPRLGALKAAGAAGLLIGLAGVRFIGIAAAIGLVLFFLGAIVTHLRARVLDKIPFPGAFLTLAAASLALAPG